MPQSHPANSITARLTVLLGLSLFLPALGAAGIRGASDGTDTPQATYDKDIRPLLQQVCFGCHGDKTATAGINLARFQDVAAIQHDPATWQKALKRLREGTMPPANAPQPDAQQRDRLLQWLTDTLKAANDGTVDHNPGRVLLHRLSRTEYNNTIRDLLGVDTHPADTFPADGGGGGGFDNDASTQFIPPILMERYLETAGQVLDAASPHRLFIAHPGPTLPRREAARKILTTFATRAFRRPAEPAEIARLLHLYDRAYALDHSHQNAVRFALKGVLVSPWFLYRAERDRGKPGPARITDYELASRLSYFLWSTMPDEELFRLAGQNRLHQPAVLEQQVQRLLRSPKSQALAESFAAQWLRVRELYTSAQPDPGRYPNFTPSLRDAMFQETTDFFDSVVRDDASLLTLLDADYTYLNEELAQHYGIPGIVGKEMRRVSLPDHRRGGILTMASVLTLTSYPQRTSPVLRGKWILSQVLGTPPPPPPPVVATLSQNDAPEKGLTFRQRLEQHRSKQPCAGCHSRMDPLGFGLENFDGIGRWRDQIGGAPIDASGQLVGGAKFTGPVELKQQLLERKDEFIRNLTEEILAYALGRGVEPYDAPAVRKIMADVAKQGYRSSVLIRGIVASYPFQFRNNPDKSAPILLHKETASR